jgi:hypothetical protein
MILARCSRSPGQVFGEDVVDNVIALNAERGLNELGGMIAVIRVDSLLKQIGHGVDSSPMT